MFTNRQSSVVEHTLRELLKRNKRGASKAQSKTVLALLFFHMNGMDECFKNLKELHENNVNVALCLDESMLEHYTETELTRITGINTFITMETLEARKDKYDHFYIPMMPFSTVSDLLRFNDVRPSIRILLWALMQGKQVSACSAGADPYHPMWKKAGLHHGTAFLKHKMKEQLQQMKGFGMQLMEQTDDVLKHFTSTLQRERSRVITAEIIEKQAKTNNRYIEIAQGTIITPLARDIARQHKIKIGEN